MNMQATTNSPGEGDILANDNLQSTIGGSANEHNIVQQVYLIILRLFDYIIDISLLDTTKGLF